MTQKPGPAFLPHSPQMECMTLGAMLLDPTALADGLSALTAADFFLDAHKRVFTAMGTITGAGLTVDTGTVIDRLRIGNEMDAVGGIAYILKLTEDVPRNIQIASHIRLLREKAQLRKAIGIHYGGLDSASAWEDNPRKFIQDSVEELQKLLEDHEDHELQRVGAYMDEQGPPEAMFDRLATLNGIKLGFTQIDELTGGSNPGELWVWAARPSMGKTALACNAAANMAITGNVTAFFSFEQKRPAVIRRMLSARARISATGIRKGTLSRREQEILLEHRQILADAPLYIDDQPDLTASRIRAKCLRLKRQVGRLDAIWIDQLSFVSFADVWERGVNDATLIGRQCQKLKLMGAELGCPVHLLNQLNRESAKRTDPTPKLADLAESGKIEQIADVVAFLHRPEYYDRTDETLKGKGQQIVAKNREGATATLDCEYHASILRWEDSAVASPTQSYFDAYATDERTPW